MKAIGNQLVFDNPWNIVGVCSLMDKQRTLEKNKLSISTKIYAALFLMLLVYLAVQAVLSGIVYLKQYQVNTAIEQWYEYDQQPSLAEWEAMESLILSAMDGNEEITTLLYVTGRLYDFRSVIIAGSWEEKLFYGQKSIAYYKQLIQRRPAWPHGWMNFAVAKARLGELDDEFKNALFQLLKTGPWEKNTRPFLIQLSLLSWSVLDANERRLLTDYFIIAQERRTWGVYQAVTSFGRLGLYCSIVTQEGAKAKFCK